MASRKQILVGFFMVLTLTLMLFFMTSDYSFALSFRANSHPLQIKDEESLVKGNPKFFGGEDVEVVVYEGKEGEVVPEGLIPTDSTHSTVVIINTGEEKTMEEIADEMRNGGDWMVGEADRGNEIEYPKVEINHGVEVNPAEPTEGTTPSPEPTTTVKSTTTENTTTEVTTTTTTPTPTTTPEPATTSSSPIMKEDKKGVKMNWKRDVGNMVTTETDPQSVSSTGAPSFSLPSSEPTTESVSQQHDLQTKSTVKLPSLSSESVPVVTQDFTDSNTETADKSAASQTVTQTGPMVTDFGTSTEQGVDNHSITGTPKTVSFNQSSSPMNNTNHNSSDAASTVDSNYQIHNQDSLQGEGPVVIENNDLPEEYLSDEWDDSGENSFV
ncbi:uncharacterized protein LOC134821386 [Bolinopsis microptera]|uniref:uncharacterized protein LOC134821386 n=1 Tax=Bolinopsis microptera TaxID=2820187 RepID=UPI00307A3E52